MSQLGSKDFRNALDVRREQNELIQKGLYGGLPEEDDITKGGEGSKGGKVIGHTKSGKPIYDKFNHAAHKNFTSQDHNDANTAHIKQFANVTGDKEDYHAKESIKHLNASSEKNTKFDQNKFDTLTKWNDHTEAAKHVAKTLGSKEDQEKIQGIADRHEKEGSISEDDQKERDEITKKLLKQHKETAPRSSAGKQKDLWLEGKKDEAFKLAVEGGVKTTKEEYHSLMNRMLGDKDLKKSESTDLEKAFETIGLDIVKSEGSRGGKVIGHTKSGKPIYEDHKHPSHKSFDHNDHEDAARVHGELSNNAKTVDEMYDHSGSAVHHWEEHYKKGGKYKDSVIGKTKSGKDIFNKFDHVLHSDFNNPEDHIDAANAHTAARNKRKEEIIKEHGHDKSKVVEKMTSDRTIQDHDSQRQKHLDEYGKKIEKEKKFKEATLEKIKNASPKELADIRHAINHPSVGWSESAKQHLNEAIEARFK